MTACPECKHHKGAVNFATNDLGTARGKLIRARSNEKGVAFAAQVRDAKARLAEAQADLEAHQSVCTVAAEPLAVPVVKAERVHHGRRVYLWALRYREGTSLARRYPGIASGRFRSQEAAEQIRSACMNADHIEVVKLEPS